MARRARRKPKVGLALAGGGPFGAIFEIGALMALEESLEGVDLNDLDTYVGVSAGSFLAAALANGIRVDEIHQMFIHDDRGEAALTPEVFMRPAFGEYARRASHIPPLVAGALWRHVRRPFSASLVESFTSLGRAIPTGVFDSEAIHDYLDVVFRQPGRTNDFRELRNRLFLVATDLDSGESVSFGRPGRDHVPISRAVQASAALPGLFPPVEIDGRCFVDGALRKTLHASEALDEGARLVICLNPIIPFDSSLAAEKGVNHDRLIEGGLPTVLSQTIRAIIHSRLSVGLERYRTQYPGTDVVLFQPDADDSETFFTNIFSYASRQRVCEHAYHRTRRDLLRRRHELAPLFARHGIRLRLEVLRQESTRFKAPRGPRGNRLFGGERLPRAASELRDAIVDLRRWVAAERA